MRKINYLKNVFVIVLIGLAASCSKDDGSTKDDDGGGLSGELLQEGVTEGTLSGESGIKEIDGTFEISAGRYKLITLMGSLEGDIASTESGATVTFSEFNGEFEYISSMSAAIDIDDNSVSLEGEDVSGGSISGGLQSISLEESAQLFAENAQKCSVYFTHKINGRTASITIDGVTLGPLNRFHTPELTFCDPFYDLTFSIPVNVDDNESQLFEQESIFTPGVYTYPVAGFIVDKEMTILYTAVWDDGTVEEGEFYSGSGGTQNVVCIDDAEPVTGGGDDCEPTGTVTDVDGKSYGTILIGSQEWMQENLNVSHYLNGDPIPQVQDSQEWMSLTTGAWCYFENETANGTVYGKLYNWYAVTDPRGLAPEGWHIPAVEEVEELVEYIGMFHSPQTGMEMILPEPWGFSELDFSNASCFSALPAGKRDWNQATGNNSDYVFFPRSFEDPMAGWWTTTEDDFIDGFSECLEINNGIPVQTQSYKQAGFSVRCVRN